MVEIGQISIACFPSYTMAKAMMSVRLQITMEYLGALQRYRLLEIFLRVNGEIVELIAPGILVNTTKYIATYAFYSTTPQHTLMLS